MTQSDRQPTTAAGAVASYKSTADHDDARPVLVIDDDPEVASVIAELCRAFGATVVVATEGAGVRGLLDLHRPGGMIVDVMMPGEDGFEVLKEVVGHDLGLPVLLMTGHGDTWLRMGAVLGRAQGLTRVMTSRKPLRSAVLGAFLESVRTRTPAPGR